MVFVGTLEKRHICIYANSVFKTSSATVYILGNNELDFVLKISVQNLGDCHLKH